MVRVFIYSRLSNSYLFVISGLSNKIQLFNIEKLVFKCSLQTALKAKGKWQTQVMGQKPIRQMYLSNNNFHKQSLSKIVRTGHAKPNKQKSSSSNVCVTSATLFTITDSISKDQTCPNYILVKLYIRFSD